MKKQIKINNETEIDLPKLISGKLLVQANSGGGKSWLIRRIVEQAYGKVQIIIIDPEGEFSTLREKFDFVLAGKGGDTPTESKSAALLARKLLELEVSTIIDLYELHPQDRKHFVKLFLESMVNAPKELYHDVLVILDEAHMFVPEKDESEASGAVIDMASRGRKRGYSLVLATQRISKLAKDAAAECNNKLIGRTSLDIDRKRAADELGITSKEEILALRTLQPGEFFAFGPAISNEVIKIKVGDVKTSVPKAGSLTKVTPPTAAIKKILGKLADLPAEAEKEVRTIAEFKAEVHELKTKLRQLPQKTVQNDPKLTEKAVKEAEDRKDIEFFKEREEWLKQIQNWFQILISIGESMKLMQKQIPKKQVLKTITQIPKQPEIRVFSRPLGNEIPSSNIFQGEVKVTGGALRMLKVLVSRYPVKLTKTVLGTFSKMKSTSGSFGTYLSTLKSAGYVIAEGDLLMATESGISYLGEQLEPPQSSEEVIKMWQENLSGGSRRMFDHLVSIYPMAISKEDLGGAVGMEFTSGSFGTYLSILRSNTLIEIKNGEIKIADHLFN